MHLLYSDMDDGLRRVKKFFCLTCKRVIINATQLRCCGERLCESCVTEACPNCNERTVKYFKDTAFEKHCITTVITCPLSCFWSGRVFDFQTHLDSIHDAYIDDLFQQNLGEGPVEVDASEAFMVDSFSIESYNRDDTDVMQTSYGHYGGNAPPTSMPVTSLQSANKVDRFVFPCGSCGMNVPLEKLQHHRAMCYNLTEYKDISYPFVNAIFEESGALHFGANEMVFGTTSCSMHSPPASYVRDNAAVRSVSLQIVDKLIKQTRILLKNSAPIEYPRHGGIFWKVSDISHRSRDVKHRAILSPCFYSSDGYNMRLKLTFGPPQNELQVLIQEGRNDDGLLFPFRGKIDIGLLSFGPSDGIYENSLTCDAPRCFSECGGSVATSLTLPYLCDSDFVHRDDVYIKCMVQAEGP